MSNDRLEFGLGTGWAKEDYDPLDIPLDPPGVRVSRFEEAVQIFKQFFSEQPFNFAGTYYTTTNLNGLPKPIQSPNPPLPVGGGSKRMISIAGREADIVGINIRTTADGQLDLASASVEATDQKIEWVRQAAGARFDALEFHTLMLVVVINDDPPHQALTKQYAQWGVDLHDFSQIISVKALLASPNFLVGTEDEIVERIQARRERFGISYYTLYGEDSIDLFAPIVARLAGT
jgi:probable F420-dependent oxidoreductase